MKIYVAGIYLKELCEALLISTVNISFHSEMKKNINTLQPLYNMARYNTVLDITRFKDGSQKCIDYIEKIFNIIYTFLF